MSAIKNVAIIGASGNLGPAILKALINSGKFNITAVSRATSPATFPLSVRVTKVDFSSSEELEAAFRGQDAVVSVMGTNVLEDQIKIIDIAVAAGVKRFLPSEFGSNLHNPMTRALPVFAGKVKVQEYLKSKSRSHPNFSWTVVYNGPFFDWGLQVGFIFDTKGLKPTIYNGGDQLFSATNIADIGQAVAGVLSHSSETANRPVYVQSVAISQNKLLEIAKKLTPGKTWEPVEADVVKLTAISDERLKNGLFDSETFVPYLVRAIFGEGYGGHYEKLDNDLLGVKGKTDADVESILKSVLSRRNNADRNAETQMYSLKVTE